MDGTSGTGGGRGPLLWTMNKGPMLFMMLPGLGMLIASFLVSPEALTDDGYPLDVFLRAMGGFFILVNVIVFVVFHFINKRRIDFLQNGLDGTATVLAMEETGTTINDMPVMKLSLKVNDGYNPERVVVHKETIPLSRLVELKAGSVISVKVDRNRPDRIMLLY